MGWFFGFKLHLICNEKGELLNFMITPGDVDDRKPLEYKAFIEFIHGKLFGDRGYISKNLFQRLFVDEIQLITKLKSNMKGALMSVSDRLLLRKRAIIETVNDELKNIAQVEHSRHRCFDNFIVNLLGAIAAYCLFPKKPCINVQRTIDTQLTLFWIRRTHVNVFSGQVVGETAKTLSERFGKVLQQRQSMTINRNDKSTSISTQMDSLIPASKISNLTQGMFVGAVSDNFDERIDQKIFHAEIVVDSAKVSAETKTYEPIPTIADFTNEDGSDNLKETIEANYRKVKEEILSLVDSEIMRIKNDPKLAHLIKM